MTKFIPVIGEYYLMRTNPTIVAKLVQSHDEFGMYVSYAFETFNKDRMVTIGGTFPYAHLVLPTIYKILNNVA
jgi:hypothetical protein